MSHLAGKQLRTDLYEKWPHHSFAPDSGTDSVIQLMQGASKITPGFSGGTRFLEKSSSSWVSEKTIMDNQIQRVFSCCLADGEKRFDPCPPGRKSWDSRDLLQTEVYTVFFPDAPSLPQLTS